MPKSLGSELAKFTKEKTLYRHWLRTLSYTDGVAFLAKEANADWLIDKIAAHQIQQFIVEYRLRGFQVWTLKQFYRDRKDIVYLSCGRDKNEVLFQQEVEDVEFPLRRISLYLVEGILRLPSEF